MRIAIALIPSIVLLIYIYKMDKREKESFKLLRKCFSWGILMIIPALIIESLLSGIIDAFFYEGTVLYAFLDGVIVAALTEEGLKYIALKHKTWKSQEFNCFFDGIVYSVFVSLGFATFENILYVIDGDLTTALLRMFTAVPGHAYDAVFMGYYYSKAKNAEVDGNSKLSKKYKRQALFIPILWHGLYDWFAMVSGEVDEVDVMLLGFLLFVTVVIAEFVLSLIIVNKSSKNDTFFEDEIITQQEMVSSEEIESKEEFTL